ncbi:MAG TPA: class I SAM-dependent methyltransferase [Bryobacteraceae bacterium]|nr:class I SAM-dependent methyltransferase [Bryobacteraceae bacterium]
MVHPEIQLLEPVTEPMCASTQSTDFEFAALEEAKNYRRALLDEFAPHLHGHVLEVGAGVGQLTAELLRQPRIAELISIEPEDGYCSRLRERFENHNVHHGTVADLHSDTHWNAIVSVNVLEHIETDQEELNTYCQLLRPAQGALCLFVPARPELYAPIDKDFGHFRRYKRLELRRKLEAAGFEILKLRYYNSVGYFAWWLGFCVLRNRGFSPVSVRLFDRAIFPLVHGFESRISPPPFGQSLLAISIAR